MATSDLDSIDEATEALLRGAVSHILAYEDADALLRWAREDGPRLTGLPLPPDTPAELVQRMYALMASRIWDATPLPSHQFRPRPLPKPERNSPCPCGSGEKFKRCCQPLWAGLPTIEAEAIWPLVLEQLPADQLSAAIAERRIPEHWLALVAADALEAGKPDEAVRLLEDLFIGDLGRLSDQYYEALTVLADAYDELGQPERKVELLERVAARAPRGLASDAWQRLATIRMDLDDYPGARLALEHARRQRPDDPHLSILEITLLQRENRPDLAQARARFWLGRLRRKQDTPPEFLDFLEAATVDPLRALADIYSRGSDDILDRLRSWLDSVANRPLPRYRLLEPRPEPPKSSEDRLRARLADAGAGLSDEQLRGIQKAAPNFDLPLHMHGTQAEPSDRVLTPPPAITAAEAAWHAVYPCAKPIGTFLDLDQDDDPWIPDVAENWLSLLEANPAAFDSLDILDDLLLVLNETQFDDYGWGFNLLIESLIERGVAIVKAAVAKAGPDARLPWLFTGNRPALRLLHAGISMHPDRTAPDVESTVRLMLRLNPVDNQGIRAQYANALLRAGRDAELLALAESYPDDVILEIGFGLVLALYRLGRVAEAEAHLAKKLTHRKTAARYLVSKNVAKPATKSDRYLVGGDDQAWLYRQAMRDVWLATPGALDWLKKQAGIKAGANAEKRKPGSENNTS